MSLLFNLLTYSVRDASRAGDTATHAHPILDGWNPKLKTRSGKNVIGKDELVITSGITHTLHEKVEASKASSSYINNRQAPNSRAAKPVQTPISHCNVWNLTCSSCCRRAATSCSILVSVSLIFSS